MDLQNAPSFFNIEPIIQKIVRGKTIVGHSLENDLKVLKVNPEELNVSVRDISLIDMFMIKVDKDSHSPVREVEKPKK